MISELKKSVYSANSAYDLKKSFPKYFSINSLTVSLLISVGFVCFIWLYFVIIKLIAEGQTNAQIAELLFLSNHTINTHRKNIMSKLGVKNTAGIVMYAVKTQLVSPNKFLFAGDN